MSSSAGHDDEVLIDPVVQGPLRPASEDFLMGSTSFLLRWADGRDVLRADLHFEGAVTLYGPEVEGDDADIRITNAYRWTVSPRLVLDGALVAWRFRRGEESIFGLDMLRPEFRLALTPDPRWLLTVGTRYAWVDFPFRSIGGDTAGLGGNEEQEQVDFLLGAVRSLGRHGYGGLEAGYRHTTSNEPTAASKGPLVSARLGTVYRRRWELKIYETYGHRSYDEPLPGPEGELTKRVDNTWQTGFGAEFLVTSRLRLLADAAFVKQNSSIPRLTYDQLRISLGVSFDLVNSLSRRPRIPGWAEGEGRIPPRVTSMGVLFRYRDPGAGRVALVGGFNRWNPNVDILLGPDKEGVWRGTAKVPPGTWRYAFVVDGRWVRPQDAPAYEDDGFGGEQGVLDVGRENDRGNGRESGRGNGRDK